MSVLLGVFNTWPEVAIFVVELEIIQRTDGDRPIVVCWVILCVIAVESQDTDYIAYIICTVSYTILVCAWDVEIGDLGVL